MTKYIFDVACVIIFSFAAMNLLWNNYYMGFVAYLAAVFSVAGLASKLWVEEFSRGSKDQREKLKSLGKQIDRFIRERDEYLSEVVTPSGEEWTEELADGTRIPIMRGSPRLKDYITYLHRCINDPDEIDRNRDRVFDIISQNDDTRQNDM